VLLTPTATTDQSALPQLMAWGRSLILGHLTFQAITLSSPPLQVQTHTMDLQLTHTSMLARHRQHQRQPLHL